MRLKLCSLQKKSARIKSEVAGMMIKRILNPRNWVLFIISAVSYTALILIFVYGKTKSISAYLIYGMSAYSLTAFCIALPKVIKNITQKIQKSRLFKRVMSLEIAERYVSDLAFRGNIGIYQGMTVNFLYTVFRVVTGIYYASVWFVSMAVYYLILGVIRAYLIICYKQRDNKDETVCYRNTAWSLFLLNIPMGGMIALMIHTNSGFSYPGYVIYLSALYTFYTFMISIRNVVKFRKVGSPILSAAKVLNFIAALMSVLGLQTAMISQFSTNGENYRKMMNTITGGFVYGIVLVIAIYMLLHSRSIGKEEKCNE